MTSREQKAIARAELIIGRTFGVGGASWSVARATGDGLTAPAAAVVIGTWAGYVVDEEPQRVVIAAPSVDAGGKRWYAVGTSDAVALTGGGVGRLRADDVLGSGAYRFAVLSQEIAAGYARFLVRPGATGAAPGALLTEGGDALLTEDGGLLLMEV